MPEQTPRPRTLQSLSPSERSRLNVRRMAEIERPEGMSPLERLDRLETAVLGRPSLSERLQKLESDYLTEAGFNPLTEEEIAVRDAETKARDIRAVSVKEAADRAAEAEARAKAEAVSLAERAGVQTWDPVSGKYVRTPHPAKPQTMG